jgi:hypothetical protein
VCGRIGGIIPCRLDVCGEQNCHRVNWRTLWIYCRYSQYSECIGSIHGTQDVSEVFTVVLVYWIYSRYSGCIGYIHGTLDVLGIFAVL